MYNLTTLLLSQVDHLSVVMWMLRFRHFYPSKSRLESSPGGFPQTQSMKV